MDRLYSNKTNIDLEDFKSLLTVQWQHYYANKRSCIGVFYAIDDLVFKITMKMKFLEASKNIIEHFWTLDNWTSPYALYLDYFDLSDDTPITMFKREIQQNDAQTILFGNITDTATNCFPGNFSLGFSDLSDASYHDPLAIYMNNKIEAL